MRPTLLLILLLAITPGLLAADPPSTGEAKLREALRQLTIRVQTAEAEAATLKATQADAEAKNKALTAELEKARKDAAADKAVADKTLEATEAKLSGAETELAAAKQSLEKWKVGYGQVLELGKKAESARATLAGKVTQLEQSKADLTRKNLALYNLGTEILGRLEGFSYGKALAAREPFVGVTRVKLENQVQDYKKKLIDPTLKP